MAEEAMTDVKGPSSMACIAIWGCTALPQCLSTSCNNSISGRCLLAELVALAGNGVPDEEVGDKAGVGEGGLGDKGGVVLLQPGCDGGSLIGVPIPCYWVNHNCLQHQSNMTALAENTSSHLA